MGNIFNEEVYKKILLAVENLPEDAIERTDRNITKKGYDTTGYKYQYMVNVLNEVVTPEGWTLDYRIIKELEGSYSNSKKYHDITVETTVTILGNSKKCVGGHQSASYADATKGAITNSFKKTVALFGIGKKAYEGTIDDDNVPEENASLTTKPESRKAPNKAAPAPMPAGKQPFTDTVRNSMLDYVKQGKHEMVLAKLDNYAISYTDKQSILEAIEYEKAGRPLDQSPVTDEEIANV